MKKRVLLALIGSVLALVLCACGGAPDNSDSRGETGEPVEPLDLAGVWSMTNGNPDAEASMEATITDDQIEIVWVIDGETDGWDRWLYWSGSYAAPSEPGDTYTWTSTADGKAEKAMLGSDDETKKFSYQSGVLSFDVTFEGQTITAEMERTGDVVQESEDKVEPTAKYKVGDTWTVDGQWQLTVTSVTETSERNEYSERTPGAVYLVDYTYTNDGYVDANGFMDGLYFALDETIVDSTGLMGYSYPNNIIYPQETPVGATCKAQACIGVDNPGAVQLMVTKYDGNGDKQAATFIIEV